MAKISSASLSVVPPSVATVLSPPKALTHCSTERTLGGDRATKAGQLVRSVDGAASFRYVKAIASHEALAIRSDAIEATLSDGEGDLKTLNRIHAMIERQARLIQTFARN